MRKIFSVGISALMLTFIAYSAHAEVLALWLFDEGKGNVAVDSTGNGNDGTIEKAEYVQGKYGTALRFRNEAYVDIGLPDSLQNGIEQAFTAEVWIKANKQPPADQSTLIFMQTGGPIALGFTSSTGGGLYGYAGGSTKITDPDGPKGYTVGEWFHFAQSYDGRVQKLYVNGEEVNSQNAMDVVTHTQDAWTIGAWSTKTQYWLEDVVLDELRVSNEALEPEELGFFNRFSPVEPKGKLVSTWAGVKAIRHYWE
jgi:hypothetical protein